MLKRKLTCLQVVRWVAATMLLLNGFFYATGQSSQTNYATITISSPTSASLGKFGDIPVGYHTGIPEINIPIYTVQAGPLKLPISLDYHASGLKVMEPAGWVGAGWALNAGGMITRTVMGQPDEVNDGVRYGHFSNYGYNSYLYSGSVQDWPFFANGYKDGEPDLYTFNFGGYTGKFYFRDDRTAVLVPEQDLTIIPSYSGGRSIDYFTIITPDGARYVFGNSPGVTGTAPIEITNVYSAQSGSMYQPPTSSWYLNQVVSADHQFTINLSYTAESYGYFTLSLFPIDGANLYEYAIPGVDLVKNIMQGVRLSQISFPNGTVAFQPGAVRQDLSDNTQAIVDNVNTSATSLQCIRISDGNGYCKNFNFFYDYFSGDNTALPTALTGGVTISTDQLRLRLDSVKEVSCDSSAQVPPYKFAYFHPNNVPRRLSFAVDHWGYFNGQTGNVGLLPTVYNNNSPVNSNGAIRDASFPQDAYGILNQITYPTGGTDVLAFGAETDEVLEAVNANLQLAQFVYNIDGQGTTVPASETCTSDGNSMTVSVRSTCNYGESFSIVNNSTGETAYSSLLNGASGGGAEDDFTFQTGAIPAGSYTISATVPSGATGYYTVTVTQPGTTTETIPQTSGGSRITSITKTDPVSGVNVVTNYGYTYAGGGSSAVLYSQPTYIQVIRNDLIESVGLYTVSGFINVLDNALGYPGNGGDFYVSPGSIMPMATVQGAAMGYLYVTVSQTGNGSSANQYYVTNEGFGSPASSANVCINSITVPAASAPPNYPPAPLPFDYRKGELSVEQHYDNSGNLLKDIYYYPQYDTSPILSTPAFIVATRSIEGVNSLLGTDYSLNTVKKTSMQTVEHDYNQGGIGGYLTKTTTTYYGSAFHNQPTREVTSMSTGDTLATNMTYAQDFRLAACDAISDCSAEYNTACSSCQATYNSAISACGSSPTGTCLTNAVVGEWQCNTNARISYVSCRNTNYMASGNLFSACHSSAETTADGYLDPILVLQDEFYNPAIETSNWKNLNLLHASYIQFNPSTTPAGYVYPGKTQLINLQAPSSAFSPATVSGTTINRDSRYLDETYYTFINGNPLQVLGRDGVPISYLWNYNNMQPVARITNATTSQVAYTSFETIGTGNWTYTGSPTADPTAITGGYSYNLGQASGSISMSGLSAATTYIVSYWSNTGSSNLVNGSSATSQGKTVTINGGTWTYFKHVVTGATTITVSGTGNIDELRLYPQGSQMTTYTYSPLVGMTSQTDIGNRVTYYEYDGLGRLKRIRDQDYNILKTLDYQYQTPAGCGSGCTILALQTFLGTNTPGYPVGVFDVHGNLIGNAGGASNYVGLWNSDTADSRIGTLAVGSDSLHFNVSVNTGRTAPASVTGCRYYQYDLPWNELDGITQANGTYVNFGDGTGMHLPQTDSIGDTTQYQLAPNTTRLGFFNQYDGTYWFIHNYANDSLKTITLYHNEVASYVGLDNGTDPATSLTTLQNLRGNFPQSVQQIGGSCYQQASALTVANIYNWSSISSVTGFWAHCGDHVTPSLNLNYAQDFMANNRNLQTINTTNLYLYQSGYWDSTFKLSRLKSNWNTYFTNLQDVEICDAHWNREDLSALTHLSTFCLVPDNQNHSNDSTSNPIIPIPASAIDAILNQIASGAGQNVKNGVIWILTGGSGRTSASNAAVSTLDANGWLVYIGNVQQ